VFCAGLDAKMTGSALVKRGLLLPDSEGRAVRTVRINGEPTRAYVLPAAAWIEGGDHD
jgi:hypothetical protein